MGNSGNGTLTLANSGAVNVESGLGPVTLGSGATGRGTLNIGAKSTDSAAPGGILNAATVTTGAGAGTLQFNTTATSSSPYYFTQTGLAGDAAVLITGSTRVINTAGYTVLSSTNTYTGSTTIAGGTLSVSNLADGGAASGIGASTNDAANLVLSGGGTLKYTGGFAPTDRLFSIGTGAGGTIDSSGTGAVSFTNTGSLGLIGTGARTLALTGTSTSNNTLAAVVGDNGGATSLTKSGPGTWVLTGTNSYTGVTAIAGGVLSISSLANGGVASSIGASTSAAGNLVLGEGGMLRYTGGAASTDRA